MSSWKGRLEILSLWILLTLSFTIGKPLKKVHWEFPDSSAEDPWLSSEEGSHLHNVTLYTQTVTMDDWEENSAILFNITLYSNVHWCPKANCLELYCHLQGINLFFPVLECGGLWLYKTIIDLRCPLFCLLNSPPYFSFFWCQKMHPFSRSRALEMLCGVDFGFYQLVQNFLSLLPWLSVLIVSKCTFECYLTMVFTARKMYVYFQYSILHLYAKLHSFLCFFCVYMICFQGISIILTYYFIINCYYK